jgi:flagellar protein FlaI
MADYETPGGVRRWLLRTVETLRGSTVDPTTYDPATHGRLVSIDPLDAETETDRYWLDAPFAFASIAYDEATDEHRYRVVEPALDDLERELLTSLAADVRDHLLYRAADGDGDGDGDGLDPEAALREETATRLSEYGVDVDARTFLTSSTRLKPWDSSRWGSGISATPHGGNFLLRRP